MSGLIGSRISTDSLAFCVDASDSLSFKGEPTTNLISDPYALSGNPSPVAFNYEATVTRTNILPASNLANISPYWMKAVKNNASNGRIMFLGISGLTIGASYCFSFYAYTTDTTFTQIRCISDNGAVTPVVSDVSYNLTTKGIQRINCVFTSSSGGQVIGVRTGSGDPIGSTFYFTGIQVEQKSYPTRVVNGTRGTTVATGGGWADMSSGERHGEILNGAREDGDALIFDGTNDYITTGNVSLNYASGYTVETVVRYNTISGAQGLFAYNDAGNSKYINLYKGSNQMRFETGPSQAIFGPTILTAGVWYHFTGVYNGTTAYLYRNGELEVSANLTSNTTQNSPIVLGSYAGYTNGSIGLARFYTRPLSAGEVMSNFKASRKRFGI